MRLLIISTIPIKDNYNEEELVIHLKSGDKAAFSYLYDNYSATLYGVILQIIPNKEIASDVLQEIFVKIYKTIKSYNSEKGRLYTWMFQIARNKAIDTYRSKEYKKEFKTQALEKSVYNNTSDSFDYTFVDDIGLKKVVDMLDDNHKKVLNLAYFQGYTQKEIAKELELPLGTVKTRIRKALNDLREILNVSKEK